MRIKIKKLKPEAVIPTYAIDGDGAMDLTAISKVKDEFGNISYGTGLAMEIPMGYVGLIFPRSSVSKQTLSLANSVGVIDAAYRGEIICKFKPTPIFKSLNLFFSGYMKLPTNGVEYEINDRIAQIMVIPRPKMVFIESDELSSSDRGAGGFGSTGS